MRMELVNGGKQPFGWMIVAAAVCFWTSWALMPGVGITDAATILRLVGSQPSARELARRLSALDDAGAWTPERAENWWLANVPGATVPINAEAETKTAVLA